MWCVKFLPLNFDLLKTIWELTHLKNNCLMVHFAFQYRSNITQNLFLSSFPLVHNSTYWCIWAGAPARTLGWRDPGFIHTSFLKQLWPNAVYVVAFFLHMMLNLGVNFEKLRFWSNFYAEEQHLHCYAFIGTISLHLHNINICLILFEFKFLPFCQNFVKIQSTSS